MRVVECFNWKIKDIIPRLEEFKKQGFDAIQINPIQPLKENNEKEWWMSYQPIDFKIGNIYASKKEIIDLCNEASNTGLRIIGDVVINHMGATLNDSLTPHEKVNPILKNNPNYWRKKIKVKDWDNRQEVITCCIDLPGLNVYHKDIEQMIINFLKELIECGITGLRFDAAKSIGLPSEGYNFWPNITKELRKYNLYLYGEVIFERNVQIVDEYCKYMNVLGNFDGSDLTKMVSYVETHDTYLSTDSLGYTKYINTEDIIKKYQELVKIYENTLYYIRPFDESWKCSEIREANLTRIRTK